MLGPSVVAFAVAAVAGIANAQAPQMPACELLVDDMRDRTANNLFRVSAKYGDQRTVDLLGGDYGVDNGGSKFTLTNGVLSVVPTKNDSIADTDPVHPPTPLTTNYFFFKFEWDDDFTKCQDLSPFAGIAFNISSPPGSDVWLTLTQKNDACNQRVHDSAYVKMSDFITPDGTYQTMYIPFSKFAQTYDGQPYSFPHNKDMTFVSFSPADGQTSYNIARIALKADCTTAATVSGISTVAAPTAAATTASSSSNNGGGGAASVSASGSASSPSSTGKSSSDGISTFADYSVAVAVLSGVVIANLIRMRWFE